MPQARATQGSALLTALFIMTLVAIVATAMSTKIQLDIYRLKLIIAHDKLYLASQAVRFWALSELSNEKNKFLKADKHGAVSQYPQNKIIIDNTLTLKGALYDLQARFNLNNLADKKAIMSFVNLAKASIVQLNESERIKLAYALNDWLSSYDLARGKDIYLTYYMGQKPPYYPSHQLMASVSELRLVKEVNTAIYLALEPFITALPVSTPININTAPLQVLESLSNTKDKLSVKALIEMRKEKSIKNINNIAELLKRLNIAPEQITLESSYFLSVAHVTSDNLNLNVYTLLKRSRDKNGKISVSIISESFNVF